MAALGPLLGGWLTTSFSWRWAFGINIPLGILVIVGMLVFVAESQDENASAGVDVPGAVLAAAGFGGLVFGRLHGISLGGSKKPDHAGLEATEDTVAPDTHPLHAATD